MVYHKRSKNENNMNLLYLHSQVVFVSQNRFFQIKKKYIFKLNKYNKKSVKYKIVID